MNKKEKTAPEVSAATDTGQSSKSIDNSITDWDEDCNSPKKSFEELPKKSFEELRKELNEQSSSAYMKTVSMNELFETSFDNKTPLIDGLLYVGTYLFAGSPKVGKSFFMAQLAYHISTGTDLWRYKIHKSTVLYLALEDTYNRLQKRLYRIFGTESTDNFYLSVSAGQVNEGLDNQLERFVEKHPSTKLIIIDTLQKVRAYGGESYSYASDYQIIARLKQFADNNGICLILVHHTRKQSAEDVFETISGTNGLLGAADGAFVLSKEKRTSNTATLDVSGRDQQDQRIHLVRNDKTLSWDFEKAETELWKEPPEPILEEIAKHINEDNRQWVGTPTELVKLLGVDIKANALTMKLNVNAGRLFNEYKIVYENKRCHDGRKVRLTLN